MADNQVDILIKFGLDPAKAKEAAAEIEKVKTASKEAGAASVKASEEATKATEKNISSQKTLKDTIKGLAFTEFPVLGRAAQLVTNPITAAVAGIVGAFTIWRDRVDQLSRSMGGIEIDSLTEGRVERINRMAEATRNLNEALREQRAEYAAIDQALQNSQRLDQALGQEQPGAADFARGTAAAEAAGRLRSQAAALRRGAGGAGLPGQEAATRAQFVRAASGAERERATAAQRLDDLNRWQSGEMGFFERQWFGVTFARRYGADASVADAEAMERGNIAGQDAIIGRLNSFDRAAADRRRAGELESEASRLEGTAASFGRNSLFGRLNAEIAQRGRTQQSLAAAQANGDLGQINGATTALSRINESIQTLVARIEALDREVYNSVRRLNTGSQRQ